jgi:hypothetical protein
MSLVAGLISGLSLVVMAVVTVVLFNNAEKIKGETRTIMKDVVDQINDSQYYAYQYDKKQEKNIMNLEDKTNKMNAIMEEKDKILKEDISKLQNRFETGTDGRNYIKGDTEIRGNTNNMGNMNIQGRMHFKDPKMDANFNWDNNGSDSYFLEKVVTKPNQSSLRLTINDDADESFQIWGGSCANGNCNTGNESMKHTFDAQGNATHTGDMKTLSATFNHGSIDSAQGGGLLNVVGGAKWDGASGAWKSMSTRGSSRMVLHDNFIGLYTSPSVGKPGEAVPYTERVTIANDGTTTINGNTNNLGNFNVQGRLHFKDPQMDANGNWDGNGSDSYFLEKVVTKPNESSLRLTINDDVDESFQIWGGSCANGNCNTGNESVRHKFDAVGNSWHASYNDAQNVMGRDHVAAGYNWKSWMRNNGDISATNKVGVGIHPDNQGNAKLFVDGNINNDWSTRIRNGHTDIYMGHANGAGVHINTQRDGANYALELYSANGELMRVQNDGNIRIGRGDGAGSLTLRSKNVFIGNNDDTDVGATLRLGGTKGDRNDTSDYSVIESRNYGGVDKSELLLFKGNDPGYCDNGKCGPDRIRLRAGEINFDVYNEYTTDRAKENIVAKVTPDRMIAPKLQLGDRFMLSGVGDGMANDEWLRLTNTGGTDYYGGLASDKIWSRNFQNASDARLKKDVNDVSKDDIQKLIQLEPKKYNWKETNKADYGFIAQDVEKLYPELVGTGPNSFKTVNYQGLLPMVVGNIKEMKKAIPDDKQVCIGDTCVTEDELKKLKKAIAKLD